MARMRIAPEDRPHVKAQCARMIATLRLNPAKTRLIGAFMNSYLRLTAQELMVYNQDMQDITPEEKEFVLVIENEWTEMGQARTITRQIRRRFGNVPSELEDAIRQLTSDRLDELADAVLDFKGLDEARTWLASVSGKLKLGEINTSS